MSEWVIVNGHVLGSCTYLASLDKPWEPEAECDCRELQERYEDNDDYDLDDEPGDLAYAGSW